MRSPMFYKPSILRRILWILGITAAALLIVFLSNYIASLYFRREDKVPVNEQPTVTTLEFELDPGVSYENIASDSALFFYSTENLKIIDSAGRLVEETTLKMTHPSAAVKGSYTLFFDSAGRSIAAYNGTHRRFELTVEENILLASINANGYALLVTEEDMHKCAVRVFTPGGEEIFKWNSGNLSVVGADIADNNKDITISAVNTDEAAVKSQIMMFNIAKEKPFTSDSYESALYPVIRYSGGYIYCIGGGNTLIYNSYGKCIGTADYAGRELMRYTLADDLLVLAFSGSSTASGAAAEIKTFNHKGDETGSFGCSQKFDFLDAKDNTIVINNGRTISVLNNRCREKRQLNLEFDLRDFVFLGSHSKGIGITAAGAELIQLGG